LAHKTVGKPLKESNFEIPNSSNYTSDSTAEFIGKKRENKDKSIEGKETNKDPKNDKITRCFNCGWKFPDRMSLIRKNLHINKCYEGNGYLDRLKYNEEQKLKSYRNYSNKKVVKLTICPICGKDIGGEKNISKQKHLNLCSKISLK